MDSHHFTGFECCLNGVMSRLRIPMEKTRRRLSMCKMMRSWRQVYCRHVFISCTFISDIIFREFKKYSLHGRITQVVPHANGAGDNKRKGGEDGSEPSAKKSR